MTKRNNPNPETLAAEERAQRYFATHPSSPAAVPRPKLSTRSGMWIAVLGRNIEEGVVGFGSSVESALRAFDTQYLSAIRPPAETG